jgi:hypothetical protein
MNKISEIMGPSMESEVNVKIGVVTDESLINDISWNEVTSINESWV